MPSSELRDLVYELPTVIDNLNTSIDGIDTAIAKLDDQISAIQNDVQTEMVSASNDWTAWKADDLGSFQVSTWGNYGSLGAGGNLTQWHIYDQALTPSNPSYIVYQSSDVTSAGPWRDSGEARQFDRQNEFSYGYDHINDSLGVSPGTYGIQAKKAALNRGRTLQVNNEAFYDGAFRIYEKYNSYPPSGAGA